MSRWQMWQFLPVKTVKMFLYSGGAHNIFLAPVIFNGNIKSTALGMINFTYQL
jgi:hypothetical protein